MEGEGGGRGGGGGRGEGGEEEVTEEEEEEEETEEQEEKEEEEEEEEEEKEEEEVQGVKPCAFKRYRSTEFNLYSPTRSLSCAEMNLVVPRSYSSTRTCPLFNPRRSGTS
jgi:FtsZ-interacting cell division protein YlmF